MRRTKLVAMAGLICLSVLIINELKSRVVFVNPIPVSPFEYEFDLLNGQVAVNPYGASK